MRRAAATTIIIAERRASSLFFDHHSFTPPTLQHYPESSPEPGIWCPDGTTTLGHGAMVQFSTYSSIHPSVSLSLSFFSSIVQLVLKFVLSVPVDPACPSVPLAPDSRSPGSFHFVLEALSLSFSLALGFLIQFEWLPLLLLSSLLSWVVMMLLLLIFLSVRQCSKIELVESEGESSSRSSFETAFSNLVINFFWNNGELCHAMLYGEWGAFYATLMIVQAYRIISGCVTPTTVVTPHAIHPSLNTYST